MNSISLRRRLLAALLLPFLMVLAGCGKLHADFDIQDADTINVSFDIAMDSQYAEGTWSSAEDFCSDVEGETMLDEDAPTVEPYEADGQLGCTITGVVTSDDFGSEFDLTEEDGEYHLKIAGDPTATELTSAEDLGFDFRMTFTFPGEIIEASGGEIDGDSVTYTQVDDLASGIDIRAEAAGSFPWVIVIVVVLVLGFLFLRLLAAIAFFVIRSRRNKGGGSTPAAAPAGYGAAATAGAAAPAAQGQQWGQASPPPAAPQGQQGQQWGQASPPPAAPEGGQQWGQASPPPAAPQGDQPWSNPPQGEQPWSQPPQDQQPWSQPPQGGQPWSQPPQGGQDGQQWGQPGQGQQPPQNPGW